MADYSPPSPRPPSPRPPSPRPPSPRPPSNQKGGGDNNTPPLRYSGDQYMERQRQDYTGYTPPHNNYTAPLESSRPDQYRGPSDNYHKGPDYSRSPRQYNDCYKGPGHYDDGPRGSEHYSERGSRHTVPGHYREQYKGPAQYNTSPRGPGQYEDIPRGSRQYENSPRGPDQYENFSRGSRQYEQSPRGPAHYDDFSRGQGQYREQTRFDDYNSSSNSKTLPHKLYSGPVLPSSSSQRNVDRTQSVIERRVSADEKRFQNQYGNTDTRHENKYRNPETQHGSQNNLQSQYTEPRYSSHNDLQSQYRNHDTPQYGSHNDLQTQSKGQYYRQHKTSDSTDSNDYSPAKKELFTDPPQYIKLTPNKPDEYNYQTPVTPVTSTSNLSSSSDTKSPIGLTPPKLTTPTEEKEEILVEIEHQKEIKTRLIQEVIRLEGQKKLVQEEVNVLKEEEKQLSLSVTKLMEDESILKVRLDQVMQNIELAEEIAKQEESKKNGGEEREKMNGSSFNHPSLSFERELQKEREKIKELEMTLRDRESQIKKKEMELEMESDMLYQRNKELKLKEYDMKNGGMSTRPGSGSVKEREIYEKQLELDEREASLNSREHSLSRRESEFQVWEKRRRNSLEQWAQNVQEEDKRANENIRKASEMFDAANNLRDQVLGAAQAASLVEKETMERQLSTSSSNQGGVGGGGVTNSIDSGILSDKDTPTNTATASSGPDKKQLVKSFTVSSSATPPVIPYLPQKSHSVDDREVALTLLRELNEEIRKDDERFIEELCKEEEVSKQPKELSPEDEKRQMKINFGLSEDATDEELEEKIKELQS